MGAKGDGQMKKDEHGHGKGYIPPDEIAWLSIVLVEPIIANFVRFINRLSPGHYNGFGSTDTRVMAKY